VADACNLTAVAACVDNSTGTALNPANSCMDSLVQWCGPNAAGDGFCTYAYKNATEVCRCVCAARAAGASCCAPPSRV
jgi:hypothetical protein